MPSIKNNCPVCNSSDIKTVIRIENIPVLCNILLDSYSEAVSIPKGNMNLTVCKNCGHFFNSEFDPSIMDYDQKYENSLHFSPTFNDFIKNLIDYLVDKYDLRKKKIIDVGCGKGDFLKMICEAGNNKGFGFDKSYLPSDDDINYSDIKFFVDFYDNRYSYLEPDMITCRQVLEHIEDPVFFLDSVKQNIKDDCLFFFEVPNGLFTIRDLGIWDLIYEHISYFTDSSLRYLFQSRSMEVIKTDEHYLSQYLTIEAKNSTEVCNESIDPSMVLNLADKFEKEYNSKYEYWKNLLLEAKQNNKSVIIWGGGSKGVTFLNIFNDLSNIDYVVDINSRKQGKYVAGTGQKIISPEQLKVIKPDIVILMNPIYKEEISDHLEKIGLNCEIIVA